MAKTKKELIINVTSYEMRVAILEGGELSEIYIEREEDAGSVGNIYKGKVQKVLPGMQSAFVNIGLERDAFLYVSDVFDLAKEFDFELDDAKDDTDDGNGEESDSDPTEGEEDENDAKGRSKSKSRSKSKGKAKGKSKTTAKREPKRGRGASRSRRTTRRQREERSIEDLLNEGQEVIVQINREPLGTKGARITSHLTLPGKYLVMMPTVSNLGISKKIENPKERNRLRNVLRDLRKTTGQNLGVICRTAAQKKSRKDLRDDYLNLLDRWQEICQKAEKIKPPALLHADLTTALKVLRDHLTEDFDRVIVDDEDLYQDCRDFVQRSQPKLVGRVQNYTGTQPIFDHLGIEAEIEKALREKVWLKSGGYLVINTGEAMVMVDVNTGKYTGKKNVEATILKTNLEAVAEVGRQIRLRDLSGIIVIDFIDMSERSNRKQVTAAMEKELRKDRAKYTMLPMSDFGLIEITRQRLKKSLESMMCQPCHCCNGAGLIRSYYTVGSDIERELQKLRGTMKGKELYLRVHPGVAEILNERFYLLRDMEEELSCRITVKPDAGLHPERYDIMTL